MPHPHMLMQAGSCFPSTISCCFFIYFFICFFFIIFTFFISFFFKKLLLLEEKNDVIMALGKVGNRETEVELKDMDGDYGHPAGPI